MRINNSSYAYFGLFLSVAMARLGHLGTLYTNLPWTRLGEVPRARRRSQPLFIAPVALRKLGFEALGHSIELPTLKLFSTWVGASLGECDVFHSFSGFGLESIRAARRRWGAMTVIERGSSHIRFQSEILTEEHARWGAPFSGVNPRYIEREEKEYALCDRLTVQSGFSEKTFVDRGVPKHKIIRLPLGVDLSVFHPVRKNDSVFRVLYAGRCSIRKGIAYLLEATDALKLPNFELAVNGSVAPEMKDVMARYANTFKFLGFQPLDRLHEVYSQASVLVLPTIEDGFAKVVTEAMACGVPVIATTNCGGPDVIEDGVDGFIVPIRDAKAIRDKILYLYENPEARDAMARAALIKSRSLTNWDAYGKRAAAAYAEALQSWRGER